VVEVFVTSDAASFQKYVYLYSSLLLLLLVVVVVVVMVVILLS
jgi:hypothetical protein